MSDGGTQMMSSVFCYRGRLNEGTNAYERHYGESDP